MDLSGLSPSDPWTCSYQDDCSSSREQWLHRQRLFSKVEIMVAALSFDSDSSLSDSGRSENEGTRRPVLARLNAIIQ